MIEIICRICQKPFFISPSRIKYNKKYCSNSCKNKGQLGLHRGKEIQKGQHLSPRTQFKIGQPCPNFKGGHKSKTGYFYIWKPNHPSAEKKGYINRSILVIEEKIGRFLTDNERVHHINEIKDDDRPENLEVLTEKEHKSLHAHKRWNTNTFR